ncbi:MAG TPA: glycosyltransferase, partial [Myxococcota bacterium]|nr:glycosyltransferase [Myxococcota bacterium]
MTRVALVHDWLVAHRGGEQVLLELARAFPSAPIYTLVYDPRDVHAELTSRDIRTSLIQSLPGVPRHFRRYLPLFPKAIEAFNLSKYDVVLSTSHCVAKGVITQGTHIAYIHTPMRYLWDQLPTYIPPWADTRLTVKAVTMAVTPLRRWDVMSAARPTELVANSKYVAERIARVWQRESRVVHPPVTTGFFR